MHRPSRRSRVQVWALAVVLAAIVFAWRYLSFEEYGNDHFVHLSQAQQMLHGLLPVRDFVERGIPLMTATSAAAQMVWGEGLRAEVLLVEGAFAIAAGLLFLVTAAVSRSAWVGLLATVPTVVVFPVGYSYPKLLLYAAALALAVRYARRPTPGRSCEMGAIVAAGFLFRHDHGLLLALAAVTLVVVCHGATRAGALALARVVIVSLVLVSPFLIWVQVYQGLGSYVAQELAFSRRESERSEGWWIPRRSRSIETGPSGVRSSRVPSSTCDGATGSTRRLSREARYGTGSPACRQPAREAGTTSCGGGEATRSVISCATLTLRGPKASTVRR